MALTTLRSLSSVSHSLDTKCLEIGVVVGNARHADALDNLNRNADIGGKGAVLVHAGLPAAATQTWACIPEGFFRRTDER
jgi:hypothetical protein